MSNQRQLVGKWLICTAIDHSNIQLIKSLLANGVNLREKPKLLVKAVHQQSEEMVNLLLDHGAEINATDEFGKPALYYCFKLLYKVHKECSSNLMHNYSISNNYYPRYIVRLLLERGADPNISKYKYFPLHTAVLNKDVETVKLLLQKNADINCQDAEGNTPLHCAFLMKDNTDIIKTLLACKPDVNCIDKMGNTPLHLLCRHPRNLEYIKMLLKHNPDVNAKNLLGRTSLHVLARSLTTNIDNCTKIIKEFLKKNADINALDKQGNTPLILACENAYDISTILALLRCGADVHCKDINGKSPLHLVMENVKPSEQFRMLLAYGADINILCNNNKTALDYLKVQVKQIIFNVKNFNKRDSGMHACRIFKIARDHIIKLKCAKLYVNDKNHDLIYNDSQFFNLIKVIDTRYNVRYNFKTTDIMSIENKCYAEISRLKKSDIYGVVLNDFLSKNFYDLIKFAVNDDNFRRFFNDDNFKNKFILYADIIKNRYNEAVQVSKIIEVFTKHFDSLEIINKLPLVCREIILRYLYHDDFKIFMKAVESNKTAL